MNKFPIDCEQSKDVLEVHTRSLTTEWMTTKEAAEYLRIPIKSIQNLTSNGKIPFYKFQRLNRYKRSELEKILLSNKRGLEL
jgi:excisionase family DNA binding protein